MGQGLWGSDWGQGEQGQIGNRSKDQIGSSRGAGGQIGGKGGAWPDWKGRVNGGPDWGSRGSGGQIGVWGAGVRLEAGGSVA